MKKTVSYLRVSTDKQDVESQRTAIAEHCRAKGITIDAEYSDVISGRTVSRAGLNAMLEACERGEVARIIALRIDRVSRSTADFFALAERMQKLGVALVFTAQGIDTEDDSINGKVLKHIFSLFAEIERDMIAGRVKEGITVYRAENPGPWGKRAKGLVANKDEVIAAWLSEIPRPGYGELARRLGVSKACAWRYEKAAGVSVSDCPKLGTTELLVSDCPKPLEDPLP